MKIPKSYKPEEEEPKWQEHWKELGINNFDHDDDSPSYVIDTPPPYPSGEFHIGNALNWIYLDFVARYKRMKGYNVLFPQGWDCHGLPTEVQVEKHNDIRKGDVSHEKFRKLCIELTEKNIKHMKMEMDSLGLSMDWSTEYRTMDPDYYGKTQLSFLKLFKKDLIYKGKHPVNWCPRCETAIADAEVEYEDRKGTLNYINFKLVESRENLTIATTRPELLPACVVVAVHPDDDRYGKYIGDKLEVPIFGQTVSIVEDPEVDPEFGTGAVMICTYGDKADVQWVKRYGLPVIDSIDEKGCLTEPAGEYAGLTVKEAKREMIKDLDEKGFLESQESLEQNIGVCWRCDTPVEILTTDQWFMRVRDLNDRVIEEAERVRWVPEHMRLRLIDWTKSMDWDWVISRQRIFGTPIPVWYCSNCSEPILAGEKQIPVNPKQDNPPIDKCPKCGDINFESEKDVLDTWMDSSITAAIHAGWPDLDDRLFPADLQPNGTDIIRTWDYYLLVRHLALLGKSPYKTVLINGMVFGEDGRKMSKSRGNYVETTTARNRHGADPLRQWAAIGASTGSDIPFSWKEIDFGQRFLTKLWNAARFTALHISDVDPDRELEESKLHPTDKWILSRLNKLVNNSTKLMEDFQFNHVLRGIRTFVWHEFCDMYIEEVKYRLYGEDPSAGAAKQTLYKVLWTIVRLLAPFTPHFAEELYQFHFSSDYSEDSIHLVNWPDTEEKFMDMESEELGVILNSIISEIRQYKSERNQPLSKELELINIYVEDQNTLNKIRETEEDIKGTAKIKRLNLNTGNSGKETGLIEIPEHGLKLSISE